MIICEGDIAGREMRRSEAAVYDICSIAVINIRSKYFAHVPVEDRQNISPLIHTIHDK